MSGTSLDGIDVAALATDGRRQVAAGPALTVPYPDSFRERLRAVLGAQAPNAETEAVETELTRLHAEAIQRFRREFPRAQFDLVGFHGHTILHRPAERRTWQLGDGALLAQFVRVDVVADFRSADVMAGGEGAPLAPLYHAALAVRMAKPVAILNLGGVGNVTWIGPGAKGGEDTILAFDTGPGNALIDDWVRWRTGQAADFGGVLAGAGQPSEPHVARFLDHPFFARRPPKSLDRDDFRDAVPHDLGTADGAATLTEMTATAVAAATLHFPMPVREWLLCGGGRHNPAIMSALGRLLAAPVRAVETEGWDGDALEAQAFAYLAVRAVEGLPLSLPSTTGAPYPVRGGRVFCFTSR